MIDILFVQDLIEVYLLREHIIQMFIYLIFICINSIIIFPIYICLT